MFTHTVECPYCGSSIEQDWSGYITGSDVIDADRSMGEETEYTIKCDEFTCPTCNKLFSVYGSVWEYPTGAYNDHELHTSKIEE